MRFPSAGRRGHRPGNRTARTRFRNRRRSLHANLRGTPPGYDATSAGGDAERGDADTDDPDGWGAAWRRPPPPAEHARPPRSHPPAVLPRVRRAPGESGPPRHPSAGRLPQTSDPARGPRPSTTAGTGPRRNRAPRDGRRLEGGRRQTRRGTRPQPRRPPRLVALPRHFAPPPGSLAGPGPRPPGVKRQSKLTRMTSLDIRVRSSRSRTPVARPQAQVAVRTLRAASGQRLRQEYGLTRLGARTTSFPWAKA